MNKMGMLLAIGLFWVIGVAPVRAQEWQADHRAYSLDLEFSDQVAAYAGMQGTKDEVIAAHQLLESMFEDRVIAPHEKEVLLELMALEPDDTLVYLYGSQVYADISRPSSNARELFGAVTVPTDFSLAFKGDQIQLARMLTLYTLSPYTKEQVQNALLPSLIDGWKNSSIQNSYGPVRDEIANYLSLFKDLDDGPSRIGSQAIFDSMVRMDNHFKDGVPDYLYEWVEPKELEKP